MDVILDNVSENEVHKIAKYYKISQSGTKKEIVTRLLDYAGKTRKSSCGDVSRESLIQYLMFHYQNVNKI